MVGPNFEPLHADFGARGDGIDLRKGLSEGDLSLIEQAIDEYSFLWFPNQFVSDEMQLAFTRLLGKPEPSHVKLGREGVIEYFITIGNVQNDGIALGNNHPETQFLTGNNMWHSDSSFREVPTYVSIICAYEVPDEGGITQFVSQRAAYNRLPVKIQGDIGPLIAIHDYVFSRSKVSPEAVTPSHANSLPPVRQKLVRKNPVSGARNFYIGSHAREIEGWDFTESRELLDNLLERATNPKYIYEHSWSPGDLVIWDNRCLLHRGSGYDADKFRRRMRQTRVQGTGSTLEE
ncbi:MAG: hypothetical protein CMF69_09815 [Magnetovibrio sp.]|nr:hypothetical protein [Magnetovibrio sp.]|tara:strand:- start:31 stop:900 length:870 start_codon:yes stop_codon:yes gene_type:complete